MPATASSPRASGRPSSSASARRTRADESREALHTHRLRTCSGSRRRRPISRGRGHSRGSSRRVPGQLLAYNCSPSFNWRRLALRRRDRGLPGRARRLGYRFQFVTLAGFHALNASMFELARGFTRRKAWRPTSAFRSEIRARRRRLRRRATGRGRSRILRPRDIRRLRRRDRRWHSHGLDRRGAV